jgi:hypothetical protein
VFFNRLWVVLSHRRVLLLEINVDRYRLDVVQGILFVEWDAEVAFIIHLWARDVLLDRSRVMLTRTNCNRWVRGEHVWV